MADISSNPVVDWAGLTANSQLTNAQTAVAQQGQQLTAQQIQAAQMQNQISKAMLPITLKAIASYSDNTADETGTTSDQSGTEGASAPGGASAGAPSAPGQAGKELTVGGNASGADDPNSSWYNPAVIDATLKSQFQVQPYTPQEMKALNTAAITGQPQLLALAKQRVEQRVAQQTFQSQQTSQNLFDALSAVVDSDPGHAMDQLEAIAPNTVAKIRATIPDAADEDAAARAFATHTAGAVHQYTGRPVAKDDAGVYRDSVTGIPIPGVQKTGLSSSQMQDLIVKGLTRSDVPDGAGHLVSTPLWQQHVPGQPAAPDVATWAAQQLQNAKVPGLQPGISGAPRAAARAEINAAVPLAQKRASAAPNAPGAVNLGPPTGNVAGDPQLTAGLQDKTFIANLPKTPPNATRSPDEQAAYTTFGENQRALLKDTAAAIPSAQLSQTYFKAAQDILNSKGQTTGAWSKVIADAGRWVPGLNVKNTSNYQQMTKDLLNAGLLSAKGAFPKMTQKEFQMMTTEMSPSSSMNDDALNSLITQGMRMTDYTIKTAGLANAYTKANNGKNDPLQFYDWLNKYKPEPAAVIGDTASKTPVKVSAKADYDKLPAGASYTWNGKPYTKGQQ